MLYLDALVVSYETKVVHKQIKLHMVFGSKIP